MDPQLGLGLIAALLSFWWWYRVEWRTRRLFLRAPDRCAAVTNSRHGLWITSGGRS